MQLPITPPLSPMLAKRTDAIPDGDGWLFEPKWDGFRALVFRDGDEILLQSRDGKPLGRYFPELADPIRASLPARCAVDGEIVISRDGCLDFEALTMRIHPAKSRVAKLAEQLPAALVVWDLLCVGDEDLMAEPLRERRRRLKEALAAARPPVHVTPATEERAQAADWFERFEGAGLDGVMAKRLDDAYQPKKRAMFKIKHERTADCVLAGFRWHKNGPGTLVGSLLLGLYDDDGRLHHVGVAASFSAKRRAALAVELAPLRDDAADGHPWQQMLGSAEGGDGDAAGDGERRMPGAQSRWSAGKNLSWVPLRCERVLEVKYDHMEGDRFRHTTHFVRWRPDKPPAECRYDQLEVTPPYELGQIFGRAGSAGATEA